MQEAVRVPMKSVLTNGTPHPLSLSPSDGEREDVWGRLTQGGAPLSLTLGYNHVAPYGASVLSCCSS
jgi:hypothetical protein